MTFCRMDHSMRAKKQEIQESEFPSWNTIGLWEHFSIFSVVIHHRRWNFHSKIVDSLMVWLGGKRKTGTPASQAVSESRIFE